MTATSLAARAPVRVQNAVVACYAVAAGAAMAAYLLADVKLGLAAMAGLGAFLLFSRWPVTAAVLLFVLWGSFLEPGFAKTRVGPMQFTAAELVLLVALGAVLRRRIEEGFAWRGYRLTAPVSAFLAACVFGAVVGVANGEPIRQAFDVVRTLMAVAAFFVFREAFHGRADAFARWLVGITTFGCSMVVLGLMTGLPTTGRVVDHVITGGVRTQVHRLDPPVLRLVTLVLLIVLCARVPRRPALRLAAVAVLGYLEVLSFTRSAWVPLILAGLLAPVFVTSRPKWLVLAERTLVLALVSTALLSLAASGGFGVSGRTAYERLSSTVQGATFNDPSLQDRTQNELAHAIPALEQNPITGIGLNNAYGAVNADYFPLYDPITAGDRRFIHNTFVGIWLWLGLPGLLATLWLMLGVGSITWSALRRVVPRDEVRPAVGAAAGLLVLAVQSTFQTNLLYEPALLTLAAGLAFLDVWQAEHVPARGGTSPAATTV